MGTRTPRQEPSFVERRQGDTLINAIIGAAAGFVLSFTGVGVILGGAVAGYLQNEGKSAGAKVGAISGAIAAIPAFLIISIVFGSIGAFGVGAGELGVGAFFGGLAIFILIFVLVLVVGMSALGGFVGGAIADSQNDPRRGPRGGGVEEQWDSGRGEYDERGRDQERDNNRDRDQDRDDRY